MKHKELVSLLQRVFPILKEYLEEAGGCDHAANICMCDEIRVHDEIEAALEKEGANSTNRFHKK